MKSFSIISLGCPKNLVDSEYFNQILLEAGYTYIEDSENTDIILINTCGFIQDAKEESIITILENADFKQDNPKQKLIVTGCMVKRYKEELMKQIPEVDYWIDLKDFEALKEILHLNNKELKRSILTPFYYAYLRISDGCNNHCSYCAIPSIRGELCSEPMDKLILQAKQLAKSGVKELIVNAQDTSQYGIDLYKKQSLIDLLKELHKIPEFEWIRLLYLHPAHLSLEMIDEIAKLPKVCHYFDIPLQHINNEILTAMNRKTSKEHIISLINHIRECMPDAVIRTTFITGFPGEDVKKYNELVNFIKEIRFDKLGVFAYSPEEGTPAATMEKAVSKKTAQNRSDKIMALQQEISSENLDRFLNQEIEVIIERKASDPGFKYEGRSRYDAPEIDGMVYITKGQAKIGEIVRVKIIEAWEYDLVGEII
jgi:ribosomal protein S12 methylthiotransferase